MPIPIEERYKHMFDQLRFASAIRFKIFAAWGSVYAALAAVFAWMQSFNMKPLRNSRRSAVFPTDSAGHSLRHNRQRVLYWHARVARHYDCLPCLQSWPVAAIANAGGISAQPTRTQNLIR